MEKLTNIKTLIKRIGLSEGGNFEYDEKAILDEYQNQEENQSSLSIKILSILGGFMAAIAFVAFLELTGLIHSKLGLLIFGFGFIIAAVWLTIASDKLIIDTFSISIFVTGFILVHNAFRLIRFDENYTAISIAGIALIALFLTQNYILSFISVLIVSGSVFYLIILNHLYDSIHLYIGIYTLLLTYVFLNEAKIISINIKLSKLYDPVRIGLIFSLLFGLIAIGKKHLIKISENHIWLSSIVMFFVIIYLVNIIIKILEIQSVKGKILIYVLTGLMLIPTVFSPAISGAIIIVLLSFLVNYKTGFVIGIISFIYFVSQYYYDLNFTLLTKSIIMFSTGIVFLLFYLFTAKKLDTNEKI